MSQEQDRRFIRNFIGVLGALAVAGVIFAILGNEVADFYSHPEQHAQRRVENVQPAERLQPVGQVNAASESSSAVAAANGDGAKDSDARSAEQVVK